MENNTEHDHTLNINNTVAEITNIISQHLTKVFDQVANKNDDISQNLKILNQLSFVVALRKENQNLKQQLTDINIKYKSCLEELIMIKSKTKVTMEITELDSSQNTSIPSQAEIESTIKNTQYKSLWDINGLDDNSEDNESNDSDAPSLQYGLNNNINKLGSEYSSKLKALKEDLKNKDVSAEEIKIAINRWKLFYKDNIMVDCNKSEEDIINDIMASSAGLKGWSESSYELKTSLTLEDDKEEEDDEEEEEEEEDDEEEEEEEDDEEEEENDEEEEEDDEEEEENDEDDDPSDDDEEVEVEEFKFGNKIYYTDDAKNGHLFECLEDGEIGDIVGNLENGSVFFS